MIVNLIYNIIVEFVILACIVMWAAIGITVFVPIVWNLNGGSYFDIKDFIIEMRKLKI